MYWCSDGSRGTVSKAVASDAKDPRFKSHSHLPLKVWQYERLWIKIGYNSEQFVYLYIKYCRDSNSRLGDVGYPDRCLIYWASLPGWVLLTSMLERYFNFFEQGQYNFSIHEWTQKCWKRCLFCFDANKCNWLHLLLLVFFSAQERSRRCIAPSKKFIRRRSFEEFTSL